MGREESIKMSAANAQSVFVPVVHSSFVVLALRKSRALRVMPDGNPAGLRQTLAQTREMLQQEKESRGAGRD
jgi:hypothetical protein